MAFTNSKDGTKIGFDRAGQGPPLILVDGALCSRAFGSMPKFAAKLSGRFTVFTYDRRGRNESGDTPPYSVEKEIEDLAAIIREAGGQASVLGISSGAALSLAAAAGGLPINKLLLYEAPFMVDAGGHHPPKDCKAQLERLIAAGQRGAAVKFFIHDMVGAPAFFTVIMRLMPVWSKLKAAAHTLPYDAGIMGDFSLPVAKASAVKVPTLVAGGTKSPASMRHAVEALARSIPNAGLEMLPGQTHNVSAAALCPVAEKFFA
ncbi:MAG TPA: alpha/beta hydrolase [Puia sp.]|nr:alpha/beta hydrolase [Puia sp.]